jgi:hypothetical protein
MSMAAALAMPAKLRGAAAGARFGLRLTKYPADAGTHPPVARGRRAVSFPQCPTFPARYHGGVGPSPIGWVWGELT